MGILMNTRGLMELVILTIGLQLGVINETVFAMMVHHGDRHDVHDDAAAALGLPAGSS